MEDIDKQKNKSKKICPRCSNELEEEYKDKWCKECTSSLWRSPYE